MKNLKYLAFSLLLVLMPLADVARSASAPSDASPTRLKLEDPPERGIPDGRTPFGTRGPCEQSDRPFTPALPLPNPEFAGQTLSAQPTIWFYVPYASDRVQSGQFWVEDETGQLLDGVDFQLPDTPGFVSVSVPAALAVNQPYRWYFTLSCVSDDAEPGIVRHTGLITRINAPELADQLAAASVEERIRLYGEHALWYDAAAELANLDSGFDVTHLLQALELDELAQEAIAGPVIIVQP